VAHINYATGAHSFSVHLLGGGGHDTVLLLVLLLIWKFYDINVTQRLEDTTLIATTVQNYYGYYFITLLKLSSQIHHVRSTSAIYVFG
jgi:hypothetical protein